MFWSNRRGNGIYGHSNTLFVFRRGLQCVTIPFSLTISNRHCTAFWTVKNLKKGGTIYEM